MQEMLRLRLKERKFQVNSQWMDNAVLSEQQMNTTEMFDSTNAADTQASDTATAATTVTTTTATTNTKLLPTFLSRPTVIAIY